MVSVKFVCEGFLCVPGFSRSSRSRRRSSASTGSDASAIEWATFALEGKTYALKAEGSGTAELLEALPEDSVTFAGFRTARDGKVKFYHLLYVGESVGIIK